MRRLLFVFVLAAPAGCAPAGVGAGCGDDAQCAGEEPACITDVEGGYCTAVCAEDDDCCPSGEDCEDEGLVCSPFEDTGERYCFIACEVDGPGGDQAICDERAPGMECRNTGGGIGRMVCLPPGAA